MNLLISEAQAAAELTPQGGGPLHMVGMVAVFGIIFYLVIYRPQAKRIKEQQKLMASISTGDEVLTSGGLMGRVSKVSADDSCLRLQLQENLEIAIKKEFVTAILPKGTLKSL